MGIITTVWQWIAGHGQNWCTLWDFMNIDLPIIVPFAGMFMVKCMKTSDARHSGNARLVATVKDGQLGYIAAVMDLSMVYDQIGHVVTTPGFIALMLGIVCVTAGTLIAAHGAVYTTEMADCPKGMWKRAAHYQLMLQSAAITVLAAMTFHHAHHYLIH